MHSPTHKAKFTQNNPKTHKYWLDNEVQVWHIIRYPSRSSLNLCKQRLTGCPKCNSVRETQLDSQAFCLSGAALALRVLHCEVYVAYLLRSDEVIIFLLFGLVLQTGHNSLCHNMGWWMQDNLTRCLTQNTVIPPIQSHTSLGFLWIELLLRTAELLFCAADDANQTFFSLGTLETIEYKVSFVIAFVRSSYPLGDG